MDNWTVFVGGVAVSLVALYFSPQIDSYIKTLTQDEQYKYQRLKAKHCQGLYTLNDKFDIQEYIMNHKTMSSVANLLKSGGTSIVTTNSPITSPGGVSSPVPGAMRSPNPSSNPSSPNSTNNDPNSLSKFLPTQYQFDSFITSLSSILNQRSEFNNNNIDPALLQPSLNSLPSSSSPSTPTQSTQSASPLITLLTQFFMSSPSVVFATDVESIEQLQKLYLLALRSDSHPDHKLQAYYDLYTTNTTNSSFDSSITGNTTQTIEGGSHPNLNKTEKITWQPSSSDDSNSSRSNNNSTQNNNDNNNSSDELTSLRQRNKNNNNNNNDNDNPLNTISLLIPSQIEEDNNKEKANATIDAYQKEITYPDVYSCIRSLYEVTSFAVLLESIKRIPAQHSIQWHEQCLQILWDIAPLYSTVKKNNNKGDVTIAKDEQIDQNTTTTVLSPSSSSLLTDTPQEHLPYTQLTEKWGDIGFQGRDPCTDFRGCGLLGLLMFTTFAIQYPNEYIEYVQAQQERGIEIYSLAITSINITATLVEYTKNHILTPLFLEHGITFATFVKIHRFVLHLLFQEWNKRTGKFNFALSLSNEQKHRTVLPSSTSSSTSSMPALQRGITIMDFPHVYKDVLILFKKLIYQNQVKL